MQIIFVLATSCYYLAYCPARAHNSVHANPCLPHLKRPPQDLLQLHLISYLHASDTSGSSFHKGTYPVSDFFHPHATGETGFRCLSKHVSTNWPVTLLCEQDLSSFVDILGVTAWTVKCYEALLCKFKVVVMYF